MQKSLANNDYLMIEVGSHATGLNNKTIDKIEEMLFHLLTSFIDQYSFFNVFKYLTFRTGLSVMTSLVVVFIIGGSTNKNFFQKK